jgi:hypothetical protein
MGKQTRLFRDVEIGGTIMVGDHRISILERKGRKIRVEIRSDAIIKVAGNCPVQLAQECLTDNSVRGTQDGPDHHRD